MHARPSGSTASAARRRAAAAAAVVVLLAVGVAGCSSDDPEAGESGTTVTTAATTGSTTTASTAPADPLQILVTNDDGIGAEGIAAVVGALAELDDVEVTVVAPLEQRSGTGGKTTDGPLTVTDAETTDGYASKAVDGFPADTIRAAFDDLGLEPDVVVSGINEGQNLGPLIDVSGTVGAARAAVARGVPALAVSQGVGDTYDYASALPFVTDWIEEHRAALLDGSATDEIANLNVPTCPAGQLRQLIEVPAAPAGTAGGYEKQDCTNEVDPTNDVVAFNAGYVTLTVPIPATAAS